MARVLVEGVKLDDEMQICDIPVLHRNEVKGTERSIRLPSTRELIRGLQYGNVTDLTDADRKEILDEAMPALQAMASNLYLRSEIAERLQNEEVIEGATGAPSKNRQAIEAELEGAHEAFIPERMEILRILYRNTLERALRSSHQSITQLSEDFHRVDEGIGAALGDAITSCAIDAIKKCDVGSLEEVVKVASVVSRVKNYINKLAYGTILSPDHEQQVFFGAAQILNPIGNLAEYYEPQSTPSASLKE
jgi:hypothetical protein